MRTGGTAEKTATTAPGRPHKLSMSDRQSMSLEGVSNVESFDDEEVILETTSGTLYVRGSGLHIRSLNLESGTLEIEGKVSSLQYEDVAEKGKGRGLIGRLFR